MAPITHSTFVASDPHLLWADLLVICAGILLALSLVILAVSWDRHFSRKARLSALLPLAASVAAEVAAQHLYDTYADSLITGYIKSTGYIVYAAGRNIGAEASAPQLMWANILVISSGILLALSLSMLAVSWERHLSWWIRLSALPPLAASVAAEIAAQHLYDTYAGWAGFLAWRLGGSMTEAYLVQLIHELATANQEASVLGWIGVIVTGILLAVVLLGWWRLVAPGRARRQVSVSFAAES